MVAEAVSAKKYWTFSLTLFVETHVASAVLLE